MRIVIAERLRPFSHVPGSSVILPYSSLRLQCYPTLIRLHQLEAAQPQLVGEIDLALRGPLEDYTVCQDLEAGCVRIWGEGPHGFVRLRLVAEQPHVQLICEKAPGGVRLRMGGQEHLLQEKETLLIYTGPAVHEVKPLGERLSLGSHKKQEWPRLREAFDLETILPIWLALGQATPRFEPAFSGTALFLQQPTLTNIRRLLQVGFEGMLAPRLEDTDHLGFELPPVQPAESPLVLLTEGARQMRRFFIQQSERDIALLPSLPPEFHCGRFIGVDCEGLATLDLEWTKKEIRRAIFRSKTAADWSFRFAGGVRQFRVRAGHRDRGRLYRAGESLHSEVGVDYFFDKFEM